MNYRRLSQAIEWAVVAAVVSLHVLIRMLSHQQPDANWLQIAGDAQPTVLVTLLVAWGLLGPGRLTVRAVVFPILIVVWAMAVQGGDRRYFNPANSAVPFPFAVAIATAVVFGGVRLASLRISGIAEGRPEPRPQFSLLALLLATTLVAVVIGGLELLRPTIIAVDRDVSYPTVVEWITQTEADATFGRLEIARGLVPTPATLRQFVLSIAVVAAAAGGLAIVLRPGTIWLRLVVVGVALPTLSVYLTHLAGTSSDEFATRATDLTTAFAAVAALVGVSVLPLRLFGYRMIRSSIAATSSRAAPGLAEASSCQSGLRLPETQHAHARVKCDAPWVESVSETVQ